MIVRNYKLKALELFKEAECEYETKSIGKPQFYHDKRKSK